MTEFRKVTDSFSVAPQLELSDLARAAAQGFIQIINNRPDHEAPGQPTSDEMQAEADRLGLDYAYIPVRGGPSPQQVEQERAVLAAARGPVLAYCRSGARSIVTWSIGQAIAGERSPGDLIALGAQAGYDLSGVLG
jgi:uncharacterized protein (TIGR01244 family)